MKTHTVVLPLFAIALFGCDGAFDESANVEGTSQQLAGSYTHSTGATSSVSGTLSGTSQQTQQQQSTIYGSAESQCEQAIPEAPGYDNNPLCVKTPFMSCTSHTTTSNPTPSWQLIGNTGDMTPEAAALYALMQQTYAQYAPGPQTRYTVSCSCGNNYTCQPAAEQCFDTDGNYLGECTGPATGGELCTGVASPRCYFPGAPPATNTTPIYAPPIYAPPTYTPGTYSGGY